MVWDVGWIGRPAGLTGAPDLGLGTDARLGRVVILVVDVHLHLLFLEISEQKRSMFVGYQCHTVSRIMRETKSS